MHDLNLETFPAFLINIFSGIWALDCADTTYNCGPAASSHKVDDRRLDLRVDIRAKQPLSE